jgi:hypothetical protein
MHEINKKNQGIRVSYIIVIVRFFLLIEIKKIQNDTPMQSHPLQSLYPSLSNPI